jgi:hypothetical protein
MSERGRKETPRERTDNMQTQSWREMAEGTIYTPV